jgi:hypothetical protein
LRGVLNKVKEQPKQSQKWAERNRNCEEQSNLRDCFPFTEFTLSEANVFRVAMTERKGR